MSDAICRSILPAYCGRMQAYALSDPLDTFRTNYPDLNIKHCDSLRNLQLSQDVLDILPSNVVLNPRVTGPGTGLDSQNCRVGQRFDVALVAQCRDCKETLSFACNHTPLPALESSCKPAGRAMCCVLRESDSLLLTE